MIIVIICQVIPDKRYNKIVPMSEEKIKENVNKRQKEIKK